MRNANSRHGHSGYTQLAKSSDPAAEKGPNHTEILAAISSRNVSTLKSDELDQLELKLGMCELMLLDFCFLLCLERFWIRSCGYAGDGTTSRNLAPGLCPPIDDPTEIETRNHGDMFARGSLQRHVN